MRRAQSVRHYARPSLALAADDLGVLREGDESNEDVLRRQLIEKDREVDRLKLAVQALQDQLSQRPPIEQVHELQQEFKNLELILKGTQRENEKAMVDKEKQKGYQKMLERELTKLVGDNWMTNLGLEIGPSNTSSTIGRGGVNMMHQRSNTIANLPLTSTSRMTNSPTTSLRTSSPVPRSPTPSSKDKEEKESQRLAQLEQLKLLILGMEHRLEVREGKLAQTVERAENEGRKYESAAQNLKMQTA